MTKSFLFIGSLLAALLYVYLVWVFGNARHDTGQRAAELVCEQEKAKGTARALVINDKAKHEASIVPDSDLDKHPLIIDIMRSDDQL